MSVMPLTELPQTQAQEYQKKARLLQKKSKDKAFRAAENLLNERGRSEWILPSEFLNAVMNTAGVNMYTAQFVLDDLRTSGRLELVLGKGIRSSDYGSDFRDSNEHQLKRTHV